MSTSPGQDSSGLKNMRVFLESDLRREVEEGNISWNDYERTKRFFATDHRYLTTATALSASALNLYYGRWYRKPPWSWTVTMASAPIAMLGSMIVPITIRILQTRNFQRSLEDEKGLNEALERMARHRHSEITHEARDAPEPRDGADGSINGQPGAGKQDRWAELRKASASASNSTWDKIRQSHERSEPRSSTQTGPGHQMTESEGPGVDDRQTEQAKFDALLEAERKMSS